MFKNQFIWNVTSLPERFLKEFAEYFDMDEKYKWYEHFIDIRNKSQHQSEEVNDIYTNNYKSSKKKIELVVNAVFYLINVSNFVDNKISSIATLVQQNDTVATTTTTT